MVCKSLKLKNVGTHSFRKFSAKNVYEESGYDPRVVQEFLRHSSLTTTQRYLGVSKQKVNARVKVDKERHIIKKGKFPAIVDEYTWDLAQKALDSRTQVAFIEANSKRHATRGMKPHKDIYCQKMRCGCGRRFKKDYQTQMGTSTYVCYQVKDIVYFLA